MCDWQWLFSCSAYEQLILATAAISFEGGLQDSWFKTIALAPVFNHKNNQPANKVLQYIVTY